MGENILHRSAVVQKKKTIIKKIKHFFEYILVYSIYGILKNVGIENASRFGGFVAKIVAPLSPSSKIAYYNLKHFFPELSDKEIKKIISGMWNNICRTAAEMPYIHSMSDEEFYRRVEVLGYKKRSGQQDSAAICISSHMGNWEVTARTTLPYGNKVSIVYRKINKELMNSTYVGMKQGKFENIPKGPEGIKNLIEAIKNKNFICLLPDQYFDKGISAKFFGVAAPTAKAPMGLALKYNLPIYFGYCVRTKGPHFKVYHEGPYSISDFVKNLDKCDDPELVLTDKMNKIIESWIRKNPEQWCWIHRRWGKDFYKNL